MICPTAVFWGGKPVFDSGYGIKQSMWEHKPWSQPDLALSLALSLPSRVVVVVVRVAALVVAPGAPWWGGGRDGLIKHSVVGPEDSHWQYQYRRVCCGCQVPEPSFSYFLMHHLHPRLLVLHRQSCMAVE